MTDDDLDVIMAQMGLLPDQDEAYEEENKDKKKKNKNKKTPSPKPIKRERPSSGAKKSSSIKDAKKKEKALSINIEALVDQACENVDVLNGQLTIRLGHWAAWMSLLVHSDERRNQASSSFSSSSNLWTPGAYDILVPYPPETILQNSFWDRILQEQVRSRWKPSKDIWHKRLYGDSDQDHGAKILAELIRKPENRLQAERIGAIQTDQTYNPWKESCFVFVFQASPNESKFLTPIVRTRPHIWIDEIDRSPMQLKWFYRCMVCEQEKLLSQLPIHPLLDLGDPEPETQEPPLWYPAHLRAFLTRDAKTGRFEKTPPFTFLHGCPRCRCFFACPRHVNDPLFQRHCTQPVVFLDRETSNQSRWWIQPGVSATACVTVRKQRERDLALEQEPFTYAVDRRENGSICEVNEVALQRRLVQFAYLTNRGGNMLVLQRQKWMFPGLRIKEPKPPAPPRKLVSGVRKKKQQEDEDLSLSRVDHA